MRTQVTHHICGGPDGAAPPRRWPESDLDRYRGCLSTICLTVHRLIRAYARVRAEVPIAPLKVEAVERLRLRLSFHQLWSLRTHYMGHFIVRNRSSICILVILDPSIVGIEHLTKKF